jgi:Bacterial Ig-like domain (group 2)
MLTMKPSASIWLWALGALFLLLAPLGCNTSTSSNDFAISYVDHDSLTQFDSVVVLLERENQDKPDTLFKGKLKSADDLKNLPVPGDLQGSIKITIQAFNGGVLALERQNHLDTDKNQLVASDLLKTPVGKIRFDSTFMKLKVGDTATLPQVSIEPKEWENKTISFTFEEIKVVALITQKRLVGLFHGTARIIAHIEGDSTVTDTLTVQVVDPADEKVIVTLLQDSLSVAAQGAPGSLKAITQPLNAPIRWLSSDPAVFTVDSLGRVKGLTAGTAWAIAQSIDDPAASDSAKITVIAPVNIDSVRFSKSSLLLFVGGASDSVEVKVYPANADAGFGVRILGDAIAWTNRRYVPVKAGEAKVIAFSLKDSTRTDTLLITVEEAKTITSVSISPDSARLYLGGPDTAFTVTVEPASANPGVVWRLTNPAVASLSEAGEVYALSPGQTWVIATSLVDSTRRDSAQVWVVQDIPKLKVGNAVVVGPGSEVSFEPVVEQQFGGIDQFYWDLDGDSTWDDSSQSVSTLKKTYADLGEFVARFKVRDGEGNTAEATRSITVTKGPLVVILSPVDGFVTKENTVDVNWEVDGVKQTAQTQEQLTQDGPKTITRTAKDAAGNTTTISITVFRDTKAPGKPLVFAATPVNTKSPAFSWQGTGGGAGIFRYQIDAEPGNAQTPTSDTTLVWPADLSDGGHTLFVQERDSAGNWSASGQKRVVIDVTAPAAPKVTLQGPSTTNKTAITFTLSPADEGMPRFRYRVDVDKFDAGFTSLADTTVTLSLGEGPHTLYVQQLDSAGNASKSGSATVTIDTTGPSKPVLTSLTGAYSTTGKPTWQWVSGGNAGKGEFRFRLDTADLAAQPFSTTKSFTPASALSDGAHRLFVQEQDSVGNVSPVESLSVLVDTQKPASPVCSEPADNAWVATRTPTWKWSPVTGGDGRFYAFIAGQYSPDTSSRITATSLTSPVNLPDGLNSLGLKAYDAAGNASNLVTCRVRVDVTPPSAPIATSTAKFVGSLKPARTFSANNASGLNFKARIDNTDMTGGVTLPFAATSSFTPSADLSEGKHVLYIQAVDSAGNGSALMADTFTVDVTAPATPVVTVLQPNVSAMCADNLQAVIAQRAVTPGIAKVLWSLNDSTLVSNTTSIAPTEPNLTMPAQGCFPALVSNLYVQEFDSAGNASPIGKSSPIRSISSDYEPYDLGSSLNENFDFKIVDRTQYFAWILPGSLRVNKAQLLTRQDIEPWVSVDVPFTSSGTNLALAVNNTNDAIAVANFGTAGAEVMVNQGGKTWKSVGLPTFGWSKEVFTAMSMDYTENGILVIAYAAYGFDDLTGATAYGHSVCAVNEEFTCKTLGKPVVADVRINEIAFTAKPSILEAVYNIKGVVEVYGMQGDLASSVDMVQIKTGMENSYVEKVSIGSLKNNVHLMYFSSKDSPVYQVINFSTRSLDPWAPSALHTLPKNLGIGLGAMTVDGNGRPIIALAGKAWSLDGGAWKTFKTSFVSPWDPVYPFKIQVSGNAIPHFVTKQSGKLYQYRTGFAMPFTSEKQP